MADRILFASELDEDISRAVQAKHIATDLAHAVCVGLEDDAREAHHKLEALKFDQAPVINPSGHPVGWVTTNHLKKARGVEETYTRLEHSRIVSSDTPIDDVLHPLSDAKFVFVVMGAEIGGFITPSDIDRSAVRSYFYLQICAIETYLAAIVSKTVASGVIEEKISQTDMCGPWRKAQAKSNETDPVEYLYFSGLVGLFLKCSESEQIDPNLRNALKAVIGFRNDVFHPVKSLVRGRDIGQAIRRSDELREVLASIRGSDW